MMTDAIRGAGLDMNARASLVKCVQAKGATGFSVWEQNIASFNADAQTCLSTSIEVNEKVSDQLFELIKLATQIDASERRLMVCGWFSCKDLSPPECGGSAHEIGDTSTRQ